MWFVERARGSPPKRPEGDVSLLKRYDLTCLLHFAPQRQDHADAAPLSLCLMTESVCVRRRQRGREERRRGGGGSEREKGRKDTSNRIAIAAKPNSAAMSLDLRKSSVGRLIFFSRGQGLQNEPNGGYFLRQFSVPDTPKRLWCQWKWLKNQPGIWFVPRVEGCGAWGSGGDR